MSENEIAVPEDYTQEEQRPDYICYTTPTLPAPLTVNRRRARDALCLQQMRRNTVLWYACVMWTKQAAALSWRTAFIAARFRNGFSAPEYLEPGKVEKLVIRTSKISLVFCRTPSAGERHFGRQAFCVSQQQYKRCIQQHRKPCRAQHRLARRRSTVSYPAAR